MASGPTGERDVDISSAARKWAPSVNADISVDSNGFYNKITSQIQNAKNRESWVKALRNAIMYSAIDGVDGRGPYVGKI